MTNAQATALHYGFLGFLVVCGVLVVPQVLVQLARFGTVVPARLFRTAAVTLYGCLAVAVVMLPLPVPGEPRLSQTVQLVPLQWVADIDTELAGYDSTGLLAALTSQTFQQLAMNVLLLVPLGAIAVGWWRCRATGAMLLGFGVSLLIEFTQLSANFGTSPYRYRIFDVDDLIANSAGAAIGAVAVLLFRMLRAGTVAGSVTDMPAGEVSMDRPRPSLPAEPVYAGRAAVRLAGPLPRR